MTDAREQFFALLAHELRTPISAIIGYHDLMSEGILGELDPRIAESLERIRSSADQLLALVASLGETGVDDIRNLHVDLGIEDPRDLVDDVLSALANEAHGRATNVVLENAPGNGEFCTDRERVHRALLLALHAAIKNTAGGSLQVDARADADALVFDIRGARLDPGRDAFEHGPAAVATAAALRLAMAQQAIRPLRGTIDLADDDRGPRLRVTIPAASLTTA